jgi:3-oxoacyl-[acyl-carrier-protein] synthase II
VKDLPAITGIGLVSVLGKSADETWRAMLAGRTVSDHTRLTIEPVYGSRVATIGTIAGRAALEHAGWGSRDVASDRTALVIGTSKGPIENWISASFATGPRDGCDTLLSQSNYDFGISALTSTIAKEIRLGRGPRLTISAACASGMHALIRACMLLRSGRADRAIVIGTEASVHSMFVQSFKRLGVLAPEGFGCRPFDETRQGFVMTEAAAAVCLERSANSDRPPIARVENFAIAGDAAHITSSDPSGDVLRHVIRCVIAGRPVDMIHAHGTGTVLNDPVELAAIDSCLSAQPGRVPVVSHKAHLGHTLGASGLIAVALSCMSHVHGVVPGNSRTRSALPTEHCTISSLPVERRVRRSVQLVMGFGGAVGAVYLTS